MNLYSFVFIQVIDLDLGINGFVIYFIKDVLESFVNILFFFFFDDGIVIIKRDLLVELNKLV